MSVKYTKYSSQILFLIGKFILSKKSFKWYLIILASYNQTPILLNVILSTFFVLNTLLNNLVYELIEKEIGRLTEDFSHFEHIQKFILLPDPFTQEADELTPTLKIRRDVIEQKYAEQIDQLYDMSQ